MAEIPALAIDPVSDPRARDNFLKLREYFGLTLGELAGFRLIDVNLAGPAEGFLVPHGLGFIPTDVVVLSKQPAAATIDVDLGLSTIRDLYLSCDNASGFRFRALVGCFGKQIANVGGFDRTMEL